MLMPLLNHRQKNFLTSWSNSYIPSKVLPTKRNLPLNMVRHIRKRNSLFQKAQKAKKVSHIAKYKSMRNMLVAMLSYSKKRFFQNLANADKKSFWKSVKVLNTIPSLNLDRTSAVHDIDKANMLNNVFARCWISAEPPLTETLCRQTILILAIHVSWRGTASYQRSRCKESKRSWWSICIHA